MTDIGAHLLGRKPSPPDLRDYRLANFHGLGLVTLLTDEELASFAISELQKTTITYKQWASRHYTDVTVTHWWKALNALAHIAGGVPPVPTADKKWKVDFQLDQGDTGHCFPADTMVRLDSGSSLPIEKIKPGAEVQTKKGSGTVVATFAHDYVGDLVKIKAWGLPPLLCTPGHKILTKRGLIPAGELSFGDELVCPNIDQDCAASNTIDLTQIVEDSLFWKRNKERAFTVGGTAVCIKAVPRTLPLTPRLGRLIGLYLAEGSGGGEARWSFNGDETGLIEETCSLVREFFGEPRVVRPHSGNCLNVVLPGKRFSRLFETLCGKLSHGKRIHPLLMRSPIAFREAMFNGWLDGDGHKRRAEIDGVTTSKLLAHDMYVISASLGHVPTLSQAEPTINKWAKTRKTRYDLKISTYEEPAPQTRGYCQCGCGAETNMAKRTRRGVRAGEPVRFVKGHHAKRPGRRAVAQDGAIIRRIKSIETVAFADTVYNFQVEPEHSYVAGGIAVANCVGFGWAGWGDAEPVVDTYKNTDGHAIYYEAKVIEGNPGNEDGAYPRDGAKAMQNRQRLTTYAFASTMDDILAHLRTRGPVGIGTDWTDDMFSPDSQGFVKPTGAYAGGHWYLLYGVSGNNLLFKNSWGSSWGDNGSFRMTVPDLQTLLDAYGEAIAAVELPL